MVQEQNALASGWEKEVQFSSQNLQALPCLHHVHNQPQDRTALCLRVNPTEERDQFPRDQPFKSKWLLEYHQVEN
jgi:hypothetical protein